MRTAMQILIESLEFRRYREKDDSRYVIYNIAILVAEDLLELEREQIINAHGLRYSDITEETVKGEEYYNKTYSQDRELGKEVTDLLENYKKDKNKL
jgi:hypothetical protein